MIRLYPASKRYFTEDGPVGKSYFSFSFDQYYDPNNMAFGPMRVLNDDHGIPGGGIGLHPHRDMEIVTLVIQGGWKHRDSLGNVAEIRANEIQRMTAGTGIRHSEHNISNTEWTNAFQMWFEPDQKGLQPSYEQVQVHQDAIQDRWVPLLRKGGGKGVAHINQDLTLFLGRFGASHSSDISFAENRLLFLMIISGHLEVEDSTGKVARLGPRDSARISGEPKLKIRAGEDCYAMLIDLPSS